MKVLTVNTGSSSVKLGLYRVDNGECHRLRDRSLARDAGEPDALIGEFLADEVPDAAAHRVVHGGGLFSDSVRLTPEIETRIRHAVTLAPLHNTIAYGWIEGTYRLLGDDLPQVVVFDTAFFADLPPAASDYTLPRDLTEKYGLRRYGFHGIAHRALAERWRELHPGGGGRIVTLQLGGGASVTAIRDGQPLDTSMGFTPNEGLVMATRCGDIDPGLVTFLMAREKLSPEQMDDILNRASGLVAVAGGDGSAGTLIGSSSPEARLAVDIYSHRIRKYIGAYLAVLGGADGIVFGGGIGEHVPEVRERALAQMAWCGVEIDREANRQARGGEARISAAESRVEVWVVPVDEARILAVEAARLAGP